MARYLGMRDKIGSAEYSIVDADDMDVDMASASATDRQFGDIELSDRVQSSLADEHTSVQGPHRKPFTLQVVLQILSVSLLAFHKVASDTLIPVFLASPRPTSNVPQLGNELSFRLRGGFGLSSTNIGIIILTQAVTAIIVQFFIVPRVVTRFGALRTYRWVSSVFPFLYCLTPFVLELSSPLSIYALLVDLWIKVLLVALGYVCSAILYASP